MYFLQRRHSPYHHSAHHPLLSPSFAYLLANPEERRRCSRSNTTKLCAAARENTDTTSETQAFANSSIHVVEKTDRFLLYTDLPGVKVEDLQLELTSHNNNNNILRIQGQRSEKTFERQFMVDDQLVQTAQMTATLADGTLQIIAPKREETKPRRVAVVAGTPTTQDSDNNNLSFEVEVPGVKVNAIQVEVEGDGKLVVEGERQRAGRSETIYRAFSLNKRVVNTDKLEAFLEHGVLTIRAPKTEPLEGRVIPVNTTSDDDKVEVDENKAEAKELQSEKEDQVDNEEDEETPVNNEENKAQGETAKDEVSIDETVSSELEYEVVPETVTEENE